MSTYNGLLKKWNEGGSVWDILYPKTTAANIISGTLHSDRIPTLAQSKITDLGTDLAAKADKVSITGAQKTKITYNDDGIVTAGTTLVASDIPDLAADKITSGTLDVARVPVIALTNVQTATTMVSWMLLYNDPDMQEGDVLILTSDKETWVHNGGTSGTESDFTLLSNPLANVTSVAGKTGVVSLVKGDVGLGSVDNTADADKPVSSAQQTEIDTKADKVSITGAQKTKITYNDDGIVTAGTTLAASDIPSLAADKITSGEFATARIPDLAQSKITGLVASLLTKQQEIAVWTETQITNFGTQSADGYIVFEVAD